MKKILYIVVIVLIVLSVGGGIAYKTLYNNDKNTTEVIKGDSIALNGSIKCDTTKVVKGFNNTTVESLIKYDKSFFDNMAGKIVFYECRIIMPKAFNESDKFVAQEIVNVFQQTLTTKNGGFTTNVFMFTHKLNDCSTDIDVHRNAFVLDDKPIDIDSIKITFDKEFILARQSNFVPSNSRYITLRHAIGTKECNPFYSIGNESYGHLWVDACTGEVTDKAPNMK